MNVRRSLVRWTVLTMLAWPAAAGAALGDCAQPKSNGSGPLASDCQFILKVAVGSEDCSPECICAPKGTLPTTTTDALLCLKKAVAQPVNLQCPCTNASGDDFNDDSKDPERWGTDFVEGNGVLSETDGVLQFTVGSGTGQDYVSRPWIASILPYDEDWEVRIDATNVTSPDQDDQVNSFGLSIFDGDDYGNEIFAELYASHYGGPPLRAGFYGELYAGGEYVADVDTLNLDAVSGTVRIAFDATTKVLTLYYDLDLDNAVTWVEYGSFGVDGNGGADGNANWGLTDFDYFTVEVYGYSSEMSIGPDSIYGDNFEITGGIGVAP